ncbi:MAG: cytochrome P450 [Thermomicrobia bacterium]|nr:cytochrome P450 [Thermomicrobia bacterium]
MTETLDTLYHRYTRFDPALLADPYPLLRRLRAECPVYRSGSRYVLTRYDDVAAVLRDPRFSAKRQTRARTDAPSHAGPTGKRMQAMMAFRGRQMLETDPPDHTRLRSLANHAFTARAIGAMRGRIQCLVDELLDAVASQGEMDAIAALAHAGQSGRSPFWTGSATRLPRTRHGRGSATICGRSSPPAASRRATTCSPRSSMPKRAAAAWMRMSSSQCASCC